MGECLADVFSAGQAGAVPDGGHQGGPRPEPHPPRPPQGRLAAGDPSCASSLGQASQPSTAALLHRNCAAANNKSHPTLVMSQTETAL